jgi:hypothetical protein
MSKRRLVMNLTPLLDLIMLLFFAQSLLLTEQSQRVEMNAGQSIRQIQEEMQQNLQESNRLRELAIAERETHIAGLEGRIERQHDEQLRMRQDLIEREKAYASAFENIIDVDRFLTMVRQSDMPDNTDTQWQMQISDAERHRVAEQFAQSYVVMKKSADALESHITVWIFYIRYHEETDRCDLEFQANGKTVELSSELWDFDSQEKLSNRLMRELTANPNLPTPPGPIFPMWGTKGDVPKRVRDAFRAVLPAVLQEVNVIYTNAPAIGGKGWPQAQIYSGSIAPLGNIPLVGSP